MKKIKLNKLTPPQIMAIVVCSVGLFSFSYLTIYALRTSQRETGPAGVDNNNLTVTSPMSSLTPAMSPLSSPSPTKAPPKPTPKPSPSPSPLVNPSPSPVVDLDLSRGWFSTGDPTLVDVNRGGNYSVSRPPSGYPYKLELMVINTGDISSNNVVIRYYVDGQEFEKREWDTFQTNDTRYVQFSSNLPTDGTHKIKVTIEGTGPENRTDNNVFEMTYTVK